MKNKTANSSGVYYVVVGLLMAVIVAAIAFLGPRVIQAMHPTQAGQATMTSGPSGNKEAIPSNE